MRKTILEMLKEARVSNEQAYVEYYNNGKVRVEERNADLRMDELGQEETIRLFSYVYERAAESFARRYPYDVISMGIEIGLMYNKSDVDDDSKIKEGAEPLHGIVHCYTGDINCFQNGEKTNKEGYNGFGRHGFIDYDTFVSEMRKNGLKFNGPENFEEFKEQILSSNTFDISIVANLVEEKEETKEEPIVEVKEEPKKLVKKPFWKR